MVRKAAAVEVKGGAFTGYVGSAADYPYTPTIEGGAFTNLDRETVVVNSDASANFVTEGEKIEVVGSVYINAALEELEKELTPEELASVKLRDHRGCSRSRIQSAVRYHGEESHRGKCQCQ